jgi:hypothetical protein
VSVREVLAGARAPGRLCGTVGRWDAGVRSRGSWDGMGVVAYRRTSWIKRPKTRQDKTRQDKTDKTRLQTMRVIVICGESGKGQHKPNYCRTTCDRDEKGKGQRPKTTPKQRVPSWNTITCLTPKNCNWEGKPKSGAVNAGLELVLPNRGVGQYSTVQLVQAHETLSHNCHPSPFTHQPSPLTHHPNSPSRSCPRSPLLFPRR